MRVGILTLPFNNNYGGYLQAYALMTVVKQMGHNVELIYRRPNKRPIVARLVYPFKVIVKCLLGMPHGSFIMNQEYDLRKSGERMFSFVDHYVIPKTRPYYSTSKLKKGCKGKYDAVIVGSDQVWRPLYVPCIEDFFLGFMEEDNFKRIAYAASFGTINPEYSDITKKRCGDLISRFHAVSVREKGGLEVIKKYGWKTKHPPVLVLDPTFLLPKSSYIDVILANKSCKIHDTHKICCYVLDKKVHVAEIIKQVEIFTKLSSYNIFDNNSGKISIEEWLNNIYSSSFIITDSFHGMVFCIIFNRPFVVVVNEDRGADRFLSLLSLLGLENRVCKQKNDVSDIVSLPIDWKNVNDKLDSLRKESLNYLIKSLNF